MAKMPETAIQEFIRQHPCGFPVRIHVELTNITLSQTHLSEVQMRYSGSVRYYRMDNNEPITYCPGCGKNFPKAGE